ncbi:MAG: replication initiator protein A [Cetobacterium sp.]|nr:replication initiator protein A [Cetobacterium sp.]
MSKKIVKSSVWWEETIDTPETEIVEENIYVDEKFIKNKSLIRMDLNLIQFPIFSKNTKRKVNQIVTYFFNKNRDTYITVTPQAGDYIPGETEEKIFIALMQIMKEKGMPKKFVISALELKNKINFTTTKYNSVVEKALSRLASTTYVFKNTLYSSEYKGILGEKIETSIFNIKTITLSKKENKKYRDLVGDKRIKVIYELEFSDHFYRNIIKKGYLVYDGDILLEIESSTARTIYMLIEKIRFQKLYLKIDTLFLIKRIPLKYNKKNISQTIKILENALNELVEKNLILDFKFIKESTWEKSEVEINFPESANDEKQNRFYEDRNDFRKLITTNGVSETEHVMLEVPTEENIDRILGLLPSKARNLKTMARTIGEAIEKYGYEKVKNAAIYTKEQKADKIRSYFLKTLENNWADDIEEPIIRSSKIDFKTIQDENTDKDVSQWDRSLYMAFEKLPENIQNGIETYAY